jgi:tRNA threonylcarbamoyladenosine biosynthesis protein TsaE
MIGSLGVGKTTLTKGLARGLGYTGPVNSPSFTLMRIYQGKFPIYHCDLYRLQPGDNLRDLGIEEILEGDNIAIFEWSERFPFVNSLPHWEIALDFTDEDDERIIAWKWVEVAQ